MGTVNLQFSTGWELSLSLFFFFCVSEALGGIKIPRDDCEWRAGGEGNMANRCDGDQLVVGACGSGFNADCPGGAFTLVECCRVPEFYYGSCEVRGGTWGELLACPDLSDGHLVEGVCESGRGEACNGHAGEVECCVGHMQGKDIGSTGQWYLAFQWWLWVNFGMWS
eukprot:TRINITY_DN7739_c0_g1_i2.p1 TRINITY_DN7739_c0_g1~~TRINITY_DN7739_c0_g1_i2.p1  ORF type:complete len:183 (-),score=47.91 TRINITY_DN7739_c0_g1_i2:162-662(-)